MTTTVTAKTSELLADPAQVAAIRELIAYRRTIRNSEHAVYSYGNGCGYAHGPVEHTWTIRNSRVSLEDGWLRYLSHGRPLLTVHVDNPRQVGQLLAAIGVLPQRFIAGGAK